MESFVPRSMNDEQTREIREAFNLFDFDGNGKIDPQELLLSLEILGYDGAREEIQAIIHQLKKVTKRTMDFPEFLRIVTRTLQSRDPADELGKAFMRFDDDATGRISFRNLKRVSLELGEQLTDEELKEMLKAADFDLDGEINQDEFTLLMQKAQIF